MHYTIIPAKPEAHIFQVSCLIPQPDSKGQCVSMPAWIPGSYMIRDFSKNVVRLSASSNGELLGVTKLDKATWRVNPCNGPLLIEYEIYAWDLSVRTAHLDITHGYFNGSSVFIQVHGLEDQPCTVDITPPHGGKIEGEWRVATSMSLDGAERYGFGRYRADNYEELIDHPVEMSEFTLSTFDVAGVPHDIAISGRHRADTDRLCKDLKVICETHCAMFGELPKMARYLFLVWVVGEGYGGLEHRSSCSLICSRKDLPLAHQERITDEYRSFLGLCSHEYFHTWNVKRIKPEGFLPYQLQTETYTRQLWAFEGITSYYDDLSLVRSGLIDANSYLQLLAQTMTRVWRGSGRLKQSVADSSFDAWTKFYRQDENAPNAIVSYYTKGSLIALALDFTLRKATSGEKSLDDLMCLLWNTYGKPGKGVPEGQIEKLAAELAGCPLDDFFATYLYGAEDLPLADLLLEYGIEFNLRPAVSTDDKGGNSTDKSELELKNRPDLGVRTIAENNQVKLVTVLEGSAAESGGLAVGDVLLAIDCLQIKPATLEAVLASYQVGDEIKIHVFRRDELMTLKVVLQSPPEDTVELTIKDDADRDCLARQRRWLHLN